LETAYYLFLDALGAKKPGFLPNLWVKTNNFCKKTRFLTTRASRTITDKSAAGKEEFSSVDGWVRQFHIPSSQILTLVETTN